ncbi:MAG: PQQ-binding-like beta-propeller repeat protein [bacterium]
MVWRLIISSVVFFCTGIAQIDEVQKMEKKAAEAVVQERKQEPSGIIPENISLSGGHIAWKVKIPGNRPLATVAYENGLIFLGGGYGSYEFYALDAETGKLAWMFKTGDDGPTAAIVINGYVIFNTESCIIYVLKARTGEKVWEKWLGDPLMSQPAADEENVYMAFPGKDGSHHLACMRLKTGKVVWDARIAGDLISAPIIYKNSVYITCFDGTVYRYNKDTGKLIWSQKKNATCAPTIYDDKVYVSLREAQKIGKDSVRQYEGIATLDQNNGNQHQKELWAKRTAEYLVYGRQSANRKAQAELDASVGFSSAPGTAKIEQAQDNVGQGSVVGCWAYQGSRPFVRDRYSYNAMGNEIQSIDIETGKLRWSQKYDKLTEEGYGGRVFTPPSYANSKLFIGSGAGEVFCLREENGKLLWKERLDGAISFQPAVANGYVFVSCDNGNLYGIKTGDKNDDGWYMWGGNAQHNK